MKEILLLSVFIINFAHAYAQKEYDLLGKGARAAGMGYAFNAIADDATGISWNPAGITQIKKPEIAFVNSLTATKNLHEVWTSLNYQPAYSIDFMGIVYPVKLKNKDLVFGISLQNKLNYKFDYSSDKKYKQALNTGKNNVTVNSISLCGAYSITRFLNFGFSYNQWFSMGNKSDVYDHYNYKLLDNTDHPEDEIILETSENFKYSGSNYSAGILLDFAPYHFPLRFALKFDSKFALKNEYDATDRYEYIYENNIDTTYLDILKGNIKYFFPITTALGISYRFGDYFTIACDYDIRPFKNKLNSWDYSSNYSLYANNVRTILSDTASYELYYLLKANENLNQFRIGFEYILHPKFALIPVRAGWKNNPTSISSYDENLLPAEQVFAYSINFGLGLITRSFSVDLAYERYNYKRRDNLFYKDKMIYHFLILSAIIYLK